MSGTPSVRLTKRKIIKEWKKLSWEFDMKDKRIAELKAQVVALQPVKKHKIPIESNERFIQVVDICFSQ